jgi:hypothetical protein
VDRTGELLGVTAVEYFLQTLAPVLQEGIPAPSLGRRDEYKDVGNSDGPKKVSYKLTARELKSPLPAVKADVAVQGDATITREIDENNRRTNTYDFDLLVSGDAIALAGQIRQAILTGIVRLGMPVAGDVPATPPPPGEPPPPARRRAPTRRPAPTSPTATPTPPGRWRAGPRPRCSSSAGSRDHPGGCRR